jgi:RNA-directed DNA polymerase
MLHAWEKYGLEAAEKEYNSKYSNKTKGKSVSFKQVVRGKIEFLRMVRGEENLIYIKFRDKLSLLDPDFKIQKPQLLKSDNAIIITEGKTDWKHLKAALTKFQENNEYKDLNIKFLEYEEDQRMGDNELLKRCQSGSTYSLDQIHINIFDRDKPEIIRKVNAQDKDYKKWGEKLFSFALPIPSHRMDTPFVCIELFYQDNEIKRKDKHGRRLFLNNEFDKKSGRHLGEDLNCVDRNKIRDPNLTIIDDLVFNSSNENIALSKNNFALNVLEKVDGYKDLDISEFRLIFNVIRKILSEN